MPCPHALGGDPLRCSLCLGVPARRVDVTPGAKLESRPRTRKQLRESGLLRDVAQPRRPRG